jgi:Zn-dependent M28 family amino/carboxypeptidase
MRAVRYGLVRWYVFLLGGLLVIGAAPAREFDASPAVQERLRRDVTFLASDACEGRGVATQGINRAADYVAAEFQKAGLKPGGPNGSYFQPFTIPGGVLEAPPRLVLTGPLGQRVELKAGQDYEPMGIAHSGKIEDAALVFAGYGATGPKESGYDDYADLDVTGKVVLVLRETPRGGIRPAPFDRRSQANSIVEKVRNAQRHGAAAVLFVNDRADAADGDDLLNFSYSAAVRLPKGDKGEVGLPAFHLRRKAADTLLQSGLGTSLRHQEEDIDRDQKPHSAEVAGWTAAFDLRVSRTLPCKNIVGYLDGAGPLANQTVVVGAHYDHLGYGGPGSLANLKKPAIHHGADDNGSGSTALMELARHFARQPNRQGRRLVFIAFSGEELGLHGSVHYCKEPVFPLADTAAMVNLDMVGRLVADTTTGKDRLTIEGAGTAKTFNDLLDRINAHYGFALKRVASGYGPSDQFSFCEVGVPVLFFFTNDHPDYHKPSDTADKINVPGMERVLDMAADVMDDLATVRERPQYVKLARPASSAPGDMPRLGIRPDYTDDKAGVLVGGVTEGGPAARGGIKAGDRVVELGGSPVKGLEGYMSILASHKRGQEIEVVVERNGKRVTLKVVPE